MCFFVSLKKRGLQLYLQFPLIGVSPDGIRICDCHEPKLVEVKCPYKYRNYDDNIVNQLYNDRQFPISADNSIKKYHPYYTQITHIIA